MPRAQDLLNEAISMTEGAAGGDERLGGLVERMQAQYDKFFFKSLAGVPLANKAKKAGTALSGDPSDANVAAIEALVVEIEAKADAPGTVLT